MTSAVHAGCCSPHDGVGKDRLPLTYEFFSRMLGVRGAGVTKTAEKRGVGTLATATCCLDAFRFPLTVPQGYDSSQAYAVAHCFFRRLIGPCSQLTYAAANFMPYEGSQRHPVGIADLGSYLVNTVVAGL